MTPESTRPVTSMLAIHLVAFLFGMTGILGSLIEADANTITFGRAVFAVLALSPLLLTTSLTSKRRLAKVNPDNHNASEYEANKYYPDNIKHDASRHSIWTTRPACLHLLGYTGVSGLLLAVHWVSFFMSVKTAGVALATLGFSSFAAFITCIEWFISPSQISRSDWLRTLGVTSGLVLMTPSLSMADQNTYGFLLGLASGLSFAAMAVINSRKLSGLNPVAVARNQNLIVALVLAPLAWPHLSHISPASWFWLAVLGVLCTGLSHSLFVYSLKRLRVSMAGLVVALEPVWAIAAAWLLFAQIPQARTLLGGALIVGSILGVRAATAARQNPPPLAKVGSRARSRS